VLALTHAFVFRLRLRINEPSCTTGALPLGRGLMDIKLLLPERRIRA
jgi:hypothetical protein